MQTRITVETNTIAALTEVIQWSSLATVLPAPSRDHPGLHPIPLTPQLPTRTVSILRRENAYLSAAAEAFIELANAGKNPASGEPIREREIRVGLASNRQSLYAASGTRLRLAAQIAR